jgi:hypothetical protein
MSDKSRLGVSEVGGAWVSGEVEGGAKTEGGGVEGVWGGEGAGIGVAACGGMEYVFKQ